MFDPILYRIMAGGDFERHLEALIEARFKFTPSHCMYGTECCCHHASELQTIYEACQIHEKSLILSSRVKSTVAAMACQRMLTCDNALE